jgi:hypothetical protein
MRADVIASPFMIECKATKEQSILLKSDVWEDLLKKTGETNFLPAYSISVVDQFGNFYDMIGVREEELTDELLSLMCPMGMMNATSLKKSTRVHNVINAVKTSKYMRVEFQNSEDILVFVPLNRFAFHFAKVVAGL